MYSDEEESSDLSEGEERCDDKVLLPWGEPGPRLSLEEMKLMNTYTYDKEPVKAWRQYPDYRILKECNEYRWYEISEILGKFSGFSSSLFLYESKSNLVNLIEVIICKNNCYFLPGKCVLKHGYDLKYLMKQSLHDEHGPAFKNLFDEKETELKLEVETNGRPKLWELAERIGLNTALEYDDDGLLKVDFSVFQEKFWKHPRPCFVKEEKKVLDIIHGLLLSSSEKLEKELENAQQIYSQNLPGLNDPVFKSMGYGPDVQFQTVDQDGDCDLKIDEDKMKNLKFNVEHEQCAESKSEKHWKYHHTKHMTDISECQQLKSLILEGPTSERDSQTVYYPCNLKHCWICCDCKFCKLTKLILCKNHKDHMKFNMKNCAIQENAQCQEHWINHVENFDENEDIKIDFKLFFHNNRLMSNGRNYERKTVKYSGLKVACKKCRKNTNEHLNKHLTPHMQCKHCVFEMKTMLEENFWERVCNICGKVFESKQARRLHANRYNVSEQVCQICAMRFLSKYNLCRHMSEQHKAFEEDNLDNENDDPANPHKCNECNKSFKYQRNLKLHIFSVHDKREPYKCKLCSLEIGAKHSLKRHLQEQHKIFDLDTPIQTKDPGEFMCDLCDKGFKRKEHLANHMKSHQSSEDKYTCTECGKQLTTTFNLKCHQMIHSDNRDQFSCNICQKTFSRKGNLARHIEGVHNQTHYNCDVCNKVYLRQDTLKVHKKQEHN
jgi:hypothetical protein